MNLQEDGIYCDCTVGGGGHLSMMLQKTNRARFIGIDWDPDALNYAQEKLSAFGTRLTLCKGNFANLDLILDTLGIKQVNGVLFDLGASLYQLTTPARGFSFSYDGVLLMQMSPEAVPLHRKLRSVDKTTIYEVLKQYGDVFRARRMADLIFENRYDLKTTLDLRRLVERNYPRRSLKKNLHLIFQALRIWVNDELNNLQKGLIKAITCLAPYGRCIVIAYHSGEDRIVKTTLHNYEEKEIIKRLNKKVIRPSVVEIKQNPASRSARMRVGEKCAS
ncbi:MAG: 16S rRNA (cytosine(1402)-N(4))-methyltransferase RsmH [candidate division WOR-3 bacterium]